MPCRCDNNACSTCTCAKAKMLCTLDCHGGKNWSTIACLNTEEGRKVKAMSIKDIRTALCANSLSPIGDKGELTKRLADFFCDQNKNSKKSTNSEKPSEPGLSIGISNAVKELFNAIIENEGDHAYILSLSGKNISPSSSKPDLRRAYLLLSAKVHPDKNSGLKEASQSFQIVLSAYERLAHPENFEDKEEDAPVKKRQKTERFTRPNTGCFKTKIKCPQCKQTWGGSDLGLEDAAYNFFMMGIKEYICGRCSCEFGCMTSYHFCPHCKKEFEYDPDDYHRKIKCGNNKCNKEFGFWMFKVPERREKEIRQESKQRHEEQMKRIAQKNRRATRAGKRTNKTDEDQQQRLQEQLFLIGLRDVCPRCGFELEHGEETEDAEQHLVGCNDTKQIAAYKRTLKIGKEKAAFKEQKKASQKEIMALKQWEQNGRQVGQLWMLSENILQKQCMAYNLDTTGVRHELISRLSKCICSREKRMITDGKTDSLLSYDTTGISHADEEDLPKNINDLQREELQDLCASYNIQFNEKDVKIDLIRKFEKARLKGQQQLMILDKQQSDSDSDEEYKISEESHK